MHWTLFIVEHDIHSQLFWCFFWLFLLSLSKIPTQNGGGRLRASRRACRGVGAGVTMFSRANRVCRATNRYQGSVYGTHTLSACSSLRTRCWNKIMSCVPRRTPPPAPLPLPPKARRTSRRKDPLLVFAAVEETAPSSREAILPQVPDVCFFCFVDTWSNGPEVPDACILFGVSRCATNEVVQFFV